ncbi:MraY family glycosyltransferase [Vogesella sp.]|uniref:MraY family glycosyltransferase n=1 Tax=Vogesella sp. TaxID=1904252 RepID=UPI00391BDD09
MALYILLASLFSALVTAAVIIRYQHLHGHLSMDHDLDGVQKFHAQPTPRVGGVPIIVGLVSALLVWQASSPSTAEAWWLLCAAMPVFMAGLIEDLTKRVSPLVRLLAAFVSAALAAFMLGALLDRLGLPVVDGWLGQLLVLQVVITVFAVGGVCHSVNIIDGYNGLMAGVGVLACAAFAYVSFQLDDQFLFVVAMSLAGALLGFMFWNFPRGLIFAGDAGAYLVGFLLAELAVLLVARHPDAVSPWFPMLVLIYPIFETVFTILRRKQRKEAAGLPDSMHFHQLVYKRLVRWVAGSDSQEYLLKRNSMTSPYLWLIAMMTIIPAVIFWRHQWVLQACCVLFIATYVWLYKRIVRFRAPRWLHLYKH